MSKIFRISRLLLLLPPLFAVFTLAQSPSSSAKYVGPGSCGASACHGSVKPLATPRVLQNEYSTWVVQDSHARAYRSLETAVSKRMGAILGIGDPANSHKCLACHSLDVPTSQKARDFDLSEGVSCESCHGPASAWLGSHTLNGSSHLQNVRSGMTDLQNLVVRSERCLGCHMGTKDKQVTHEMIAAGHPALVFELDSYTALMPPHWRSSVDPNFGARDWSIGQATALRESLDRLARHASTGQWPEYSDLECFACHHSLTTSPNSWRQQRGYSNRQPGAPPFDASHYSVFRILTAEISPSDAKNLDSAMEEVFKTTSKYHGTAGEVAAAAEKASSVASDFVSKVELAPHDRALTAHLLTRLVEQGDRLADADTRTAEQAAMAVDSLYISYSRQGGQNSAVRKAIDGLFKLLQDPSAYSAPQFRAQLKLIGAELKAAGVQ